MHSDILKPEIQQFIFEKSDSIIDLNQLILTGSPFANVSIKELAAQIAGRRKIKKKLPRWHIQEGIYYPPILNLEQTSSETTALYKSNLISGKTLIDLTGGFGVDDYYFSKSMDHVFHCEINKPLQQLASHNLVTLEAHNITSYASDGLTVLKNLDSVDWIYIDPSRRHDRKGKVFFLEDCLPNVPEHLDFLCSKSTNILIKTSPLLDISAGIQSLKKVREIHILAVQNEVKELLWIIDTSYQKEVMIKTININKTENQQFSFQFSEEESAIASFTEPLGYVYEPNAAILKSGGFKCLAQKYGVHKLHPNSHLYTASTAIDFPGRKFEVVSQTPYHKKTIAKMGINKANITTRNFPDSVALIRKKLKIKDGGDIYLFFTTNLKNEKIMLLCKKI